MSAEDGVQDGLQRQIAEEKALKGRPSRARRTNCAPFMPGIAKSASKRSIRSPS